ncbi:hypothetical protein JS44_13695 [Anoxybacillus flavithermus]|uniref:Uncharacterized protein n=1 Tax=Anoxybacillus flavithermus TaxID=33934 RepID=A0A094J2I5_9BACL|nr:hypothetical protein JS44_13695 [Anoxybacillus flavithermus]
MDADRDAASVPVTSRRLSKIDRNRESLIGSLFLFSHQPAFETYIIPLNAFIPLWNGGDFV